MNTTRNDLSVMRFLTTGPKSVSDVLKSGVVVTEGRSKSDICRYVLERLVERSFARKDRVTPLTSGPQASVYYEITPAGQDEVRRLDGQPQAAAE